MYVLNVISRKIQIVRSLHPYDTNPATTAAAAELLIEEKRKEGKHQEKQENEKRGKVNFV